MNEFDILCKCGHSKSGHSRFGPHTMQDYQSCICWLGRNRGLGLKKTNWRTCKCEQYQPDNLSHIEQVAKQKGLV